MPVLFSMGDLQRRQVPSGTSSGNGDRHSGQYSKRQLPNISRVLTEWFNASFFLSNSDINIVESSISYSSMSSSSSTAAHSWFKRRTSDFCLSVSVLFCSLISSPCLFLVISSDILP